MAEKLRMALVDVLCKAGVEQADFLREGVRVLREGVRVLAQELMELEVAEQPGAERHERTPERTGYRNGYHERPWDTRVGTIELHVPRVRDGGKTAETGVHGGSRAPGGQRLSGPPRHVAPA